MSKETLKPADEAGADGTQLVTFLLKDEEFGFDIMSVQEIIRLPKMAKLPHTPDYVEGVSSLRGVLLPIFDIRARFGMKREEHTERSRVLVIDIDGKRTGLLVDGVRQVTRIGRNEFERPPAAIRGETSNYIDGIVKLDNGKRIIIALDARRVCSMSGSSETVEEIVKAVAKVDATKSSKRLKVGREQSVITGKGGDVHQLVSFQVGREEFAFPMEDVREILRVEPPKAVPGAPEHLLGVLTVRGKILPIVDLRRLMRQNSFAMDHVKDIRLATAEYDSWLQESGQATPGAELERALKASERLRHWLTSFNSSSQVLMETITQVRGLNEHVSKQVSGIAERLMDSNALGAVHKDVVACARNIVSAVRSFEGNVDGAIHEDQRIIVVDSNGFQLGLVVDHVNEVLGISDEAIEGPPSVAQNEGFKLSGIAKLDDGNRLILLLATGNLLDQKVIEALADDAQDVTTGKELKQVEKKGKDAEQDGEELQFVTFLLGEEEYGIPIAKIQEIDRLSRITRTPKAPKFVEGVTNLRGEVIPVLSTRALFALETKAPDDRTRIIIVDLGGTKTGLVVDSVREVLSISSRNIAPPPSSISNGADSKFISGIGKVESGKRMIVLLDVERVMTRGERGALADLSHASEARA